GQQYRGEQEGDAPPGALERLSRRKPADEYHDERQGEARAARGLDPGRVAAATIGRSVLRDEHRRASIFAAEGETLQQPQDEQEAGSRDADRGVTGQAADEEGGRSHDDDRDEEGALAPDEIAEPAEDHRPERANERAGGEGEEREDETRGLVGGGEELPRD